MSEIVRYKMQLPQTAAEIRTHVNTIQEVMRAVMKADVHYGKIPGTGGKNTLLKPGAEVLLTTFRVSVRPEVDDLSTADEIRYRVRAVGVHMGTETVVGIGLGECSTGEEKFKWRGAMQGEWSATDESRRRIKYSSRSGGERGQKIETMTNQVRTNPADLANTVLKMAKKRAEVDLCLTALAASDIFTQDIEDGVIDVETGEIQPAPHPKAQSAAPRARERNPDGQQRNIATDKQIGLIRARLNDAGLGEVALLDKYGMAKIEELQFNDVNDVLAWIGKGGM